mmetsp:Transcript_16885/g.36814  ORF Transcript_16885/g.36814 Transcript_16885/m.36814 type:complete len:297 (-) Transcript_16885:1025-1915(-)
MAGRLQRTDFWTPWHDRHIVQFVWRGEVVVGGVLHQEEPSWDSRAKRKNLEPRDCSRCALQNSLDLVFPTKGVVSIPCATARCCVLQLKIRFALEFLYLMQTTEDEPAWVGNHLELQPIPTNKSTSKACRKSCLLKDPLAPLPFDSHPCFPQTDCRQWKADSFCRRHRLMFALSYWVEVSHCHPWSLSPFPHLHRDFFSPSIQMPEEVPLTSLSILLLPAKASCFRHWLEAVARHYSHWSISSSPMTVLQDFEVSHPCLFSGVAVLMKQMLENPNWMSSLVGREAPAFWPFSPHLQ